MNDLLTSHASFEETGKWISKETDIICDNAAIREIVEQSRSGHKQTDIYDEITFRLGVPDDIRSKVEQRLNYAYTSQDEGYIVDAAENGITVYAEQGRGLLYGAVTLSKLADDGFVRYGVVYNFPTCPVRGLKVYLPDEAGMDYFKKFVDMLAHYKYNTIVLEVGGAMEYKKHPEINDGWVRYCEEMYEYSGKTIVIQEQTFSWYKNSIHAENGGGRYLSQEQVRELVQYCKDRYFDVIPEVPSLSHCDFLLINHPELRERKEDPYPDTYCPSDERSYELLFDVLDEVLEVFDPKTVHVGHDEWYSIGLCDKCKSKPADQIYADDLIKIYRFLKERGVQTMIWSEKLLNAITSDGKTYGGSERRMVNYETGVYMGETIPATYTAIDLVPRDILMMHWYWGVERHFDQPFFERGMPLVFGNFDGPEFVDWKDRLGLGALGAVISNWSALKEENLQRNRILFSMVYSAYLFWREDYEDSLHEEIAKLVFEELFHYRYGKLIRDARSKPAASSGTSYIEVLHTTNANREYRIFMDGVYLNNAEHRLGEYVLQYTDGTSVSVPITYGHNISGKDRFWNRHTNGKDSHSSGSYVVDLSLFEAAYTSLPIQIGEETYYRWIIESPYPDKTVANVRLTVDHPADYNIFVNELKIVPEAPAGKPEGKPGPTEIRGEATLA